jgi:hypothetical protein
MGPISMISSSTVAHCRVEHHETDNADKGNENEQQGDRGRAGVVRARRLLQRSRCWAYHHCPDSRPRCCHQKICRQKMAPAHAAFQVGATLVRRFWIPSVEPKLSNLFAALGTRASRRTVLISMRLHRFRAGNRICEYFAIVPILRRFSARGRRAREQKNGPCI